MENAWCCCGRSPETAQQAGYDDADQEASVILHREMFPSFETSGDSLSLKQASTLQRVLSSSASLSLGKNWTITPSSFKASQDLGKSTGALKKFYTVASIAEEKEESHGLEKRGLVRGIWESITSSQEGLQEFLDVGQVGWLKQRMILQLAPYTTITQEICGEDDVFVIVTAHPKGVEKQEFVAGGPEFDGEFGAELSKGTGRAWWDGETLVYQIKTATKEEEHRRWVIEGDLLRQTIKQPKVGGLLQ